MTKKQLEIIRAEIAFFGFLCCSVSSDYLITGMMFLAGAIFIAWYRWSIDG